MVTSGAAVAASPAPVPVVAAVPAADAAPEAPATLTLTPADREKALKLLGGLSAGLMVAAFGLVGLLRVPGLAQQLKAGLLCLGG